MDLNPSGLPLRKVTYMWVRISTPHKNHLKIFHLVLTVTAEAVATGGAGGWGGGTRRWRRRERRWLVPAVEGATSAGHHAWRPVGVEAAGNSSGAGRASYTRGGRLERRAGGGRRSAPGSWRTGGRRAAVIAFGHGMFSVVDLDLAI
jgi:hypothetical protein